MTHPNIGSDAPEFMSCLRKLREAEEEVRKLRKELHIEETIVVQIGNTDNKLNQNVWSVFCNDLLSHVQECSKEIHLTGGPPTSSPYQNFVVIATLLPEKLEELKGRLSTLILNYNQDSIALTVGPTEFIQV